jgi:hypothetical protein
VKQSFIRIYEPAEKVVHIDAPGGLDCVTLCGKTDWLGEERGYETNKPVTCWHCQQVAAFCQRHRRLTTKRKASLVTRPDGGGK